MLVSSDDSSIHVPPTCSQHFCTVIELLCHALPITFTQYKLSFFNSNCTTSFFDNGVICAMFTDMNVKCFCCHSIHNTLPTDESSVLVKCCVVYCICAATLEIFQNHISDVSHFFTCSVFDAPIRSTCVRK